MGQCYGSEEKYRLVKRYQNGESVADICTETGVARSTFYMQSFLLAGDDYSTYYFNADTYQIIDDEHSVVLETREPIEMQTLLDYLGQAGKKLNTAYVTRILKKWSIKVFDDAGAVQMYPTPIIQMLQGFIEVGKNKTVAHLLSGDWYVLEPNYTAALDREYGELFESTKEKCETIKKTYLPKAHESITEDDYNIKYLINRSQILVAHTALIDNIELADAIFSDQDNVYLLHNKRKFDGSGTRDLTNQILGASEYLQQRLSRERLPFLREYYQKIRTASRLSTQDIRIDETQFANLFNKKICFIAGYVNGFGKDCNSNYAKYLTIELYQKLASRGQDFISIALT